MLDFGQEITGWAEFLCDEEEGRKSGSQYGEVLQDGCFYRDNLRTAKAEMTIFLPEKKRWVRPHFTFYGFPLCESDRNDRGRSQKFYCLCDTFRYQQNRKYPDLLRESEPLFENTVWGQKGNFLDVPTDCPQRDERLGWDGDRPGFLRYSFFSYGDAGFLSENISMT